MDIATPEHRSAFRVNDPRSGFTLIEMMGVLVIGAVLAAALVPKMVKRTDLAVRSQEVANLGVISNALVRQTVRSGTVTESTGWPTNVASASGFSVNQTVANARLYNRVYFTQVSPTPLSLPYTQTNIGTSKPAKLRAIIVSLLGGDLLSAANCPNQSGGALTDADFNALWNTPDGRRPTSGLWTNWNGSRDDFLMQRLDYAPLFHHLVLVNRDTNFTAAFTINGSSTINVTNNVTNNWDAYYVDGTVVGLCNLNNTPIMQTPYVLTRDISFVFEEGLWRGQIMGVANSSTNADNFSTKAASFLASQWYSGAHSGADQQGALAAMYSFMYTYALWANECPHFSWHNASSSIQVPEYEMLNDIGANNAFLDKFTGANGLLK
jgi:prepilin-type N-terminal cleavage/methylation domain-containing protein